MIFNVYRLITFRPTGGDHIENQEKYFCFREHEEADLEGISGPLIELNPISDDNPLRLFQQIVSMYRPGDTITSEEPRAITNPQGSSVADLAEAISREEMRMLALAVADKLRCLKE